MKDTFDRFQAAQRGRFGDNETHPRQRQQSVKEGDCGFWLAVTPYPGALVFDQPTVRVTLPKPFAKEKGLI